MPRVMLVPVQNTPTPCTNTRARRVSEVLRVSTAVEMQCGDVLALRGR